MSSRSNATTTPFRLSRDEAFLMRPSFIHLISAHRRWKERGSSMIAPAANLPIEHRTQEGVFNQDCQNTILHVAVIATNSFTARSRRIRLNPIELASCILAVRVTETMCRHKHLQPIPRNYKVRCRRLVRRLERLRKRAKRAYIRAHGQRAFTEASRRWQEHVRFVRAFFLFCTCNRTIHPNPAGKRLRKLKEDEWIEFFREELPAHGLDVPPEPELRALVKRALRVGRRCIRQYGRMTVHNNHDLLQDRMTNYVIRRCRKYPDSLVTRHNLQSRER